MDDPDFNLDDVVVFELPTVEDAAAFSARFSPRCDGWSQADEPVWLFAARLDTELDLAALLRDAQELVAELGLTAIRFCLDGRLYELKATKPRREADLAASSK